MTIASFDQRHQASNPATPLETLAELAHRFAELRPLVASNPSTYEGLLEWLGSLDDPAVDAALRTRYGIPQPVVVQQAYVPTAPYVPAYQHSPPERGRAGYVAGTVIIFVGAVFYLFVLFTPGIPWVLTPVPFVFAGLFVLGFALLPTSGPRRVTAATLGGVGAFAMASSLLWNSPLAWLEEKLWAIGGVAEGVAAVLVLCAWLIARERRAISYLVVLIPIVALVIHSIAFGRQLFLYGLYDTLIGPVFEVGTPPSIVLLMTLLFIGWTILVIVPAWIARAISGPTRPRQQPPAQGGWQAAGASVPMTPYGR